MTARTQATNGKDKPVQRSTATGTEARVGRALWLVVGLLGLSVLLVVLGVYATTRAENLDVSGYSSGVIMSSLKTFAMVHNVNVSHLTLGSFLGLLGVYLEENRKQLLTAAIVFLSFGIITSFLCLVIDGASIALNMDMRPLRAGRCQYYSSGGGYLYENVYTSVTCWNSKESCNMTVRSGTCYCCDLYDCGNGGYLSNYYEFVGVRSCEEVFSLYVMIWTLSALNLAAFFAGVLNTAVLGNIKTLSQRSSGPVIEPSTCPASFPTAPLLTDVNTHTAQQPHPTACVCPPAAEGAAA